MTELTFASAVQLADWVAERAVSPVELVEACLSRIERLDGDVNSMVALDSERALATARRAEATAGNADCAPLHGVPVAIKDLHLTEGLTTTFGTRSMAAFVPTADEENVARLRAAGAIVIGKTNVPEWGTVPLTEPALHGPCRNPWDTERTPGGSSGGAAAAVAAGLVPFAHGSDGGGSIRIPASHCGLFGLKPARGRVSNAPVSGDRLAGLATVGPISRHVADAAAMLDAMRGYAVGDPHWAPAPSRPFLEEVHREPPPLRVGLVDPTGVTHFAPQAAAAAEEAGHLFERLGHTVEPFELPVSDEFRSHFRVLWAAGVGSLWVDPGTLERVNAELFHAGHSWSAGTLLRAVNALQREARAVVGASLAFDVVLSPTMAEPPLRIGELGDASMDTAFERFSDYVGLTPLANVTGQPAMSLPLSWTDEGLPLGVMVTGRPADEATLFRLAGQIQRAADWSGQRPPVS